ncbi:MAG: hypothetical protein AMXMBFR33_31880 [Candidatus Xenobia bacterium]
MYRYDGLEKRLTILKPATREALFSESMLRPLGEVPRRVDGDLRRLEDGLRLGDKHNHTRWLVEDDLEPEAMVARIHEVLVERLSQVRLTSQPKRIAIAGGGPGGLTAAIECAMQGHEVSLFEQHPAPERARCVGLFRQEERYLSSLGAPRSLRSEIPVSYADKSNIWLFDLISFLGIVALKAGVTLHSPCRLELQGESLRAGPPPHSQNPEVIRFFGTQRQTMPADFTVSYDVLIDASGGHSSLRNGLVGADRVVGLREKARDALRLDDRLESYLEGQESELRVIDQRFASQSEAWREFVPLVLALDPRIDDAPLCLVCSIDRSVFTFRSLPDLYSQGLVPPDWVFAPTSYGDHLDPSTWHGLDENQIRRVHLEGMLPSLAEGVKAPPWNIALAILAAMGLSESIDDAALARYVREENDFPCLAHDTMSLFRSRLTGVRTVSSEPASWGRIGQGEYFVIGDALQTAWFRFGVGVHDACRAGEMVARCLQEPDLERRALLVKDFENVLQRRAVQTMFCLYLNETRLSQDRTILAALTSPPGREARVHHLDGWTSAAGAPRPG